MPSNPTNNSKARKPSGKKIRTTGPLLSVFKWFFKIFGTLLLIGMTTGVMLGCIFAIYIDKHINTNLEIDPHEFQLDLTSFVYYLDKETGEYKVLEELFARENRIWVSYEEIPEHLIDALVAIEDQRFWRHHGVDWYRTTGAFFNMFLGMKDNFGGSTITQQLIKNLTEEDEVTVRRKITEIFRAIELERQYSKEDILEWYLNLVYFSQGCNGVQSAAQTYFGKDVSELTLAESASIVGITNLPTKYDPYINRDNNKARQEVILREMHRQGIISEEEMNKAIKEKLVFRRDARPIDSGEKESKYQSYFVDQVIEDVLTDLMIQKGVSYKVATQLLYRGGYHIYTTIDMDVQAAIDEVYTNPEYWPELKETDGESPQSAIIVMDHRTGDIVGMYGGLGEKTSNRSWNRATMTLRQPGSSIKPIAVYAPAVDAGLVTPYTVYTDMPIMKSGDKPWPKNYDQSSVGYRGQVTIMEAVQRSMNTVPAKLVMQMSPARCFEFAKYKMGLVSLVESLKIGNKEHTDVDIAPMSLGGLTRGVTVRELSEAYSVFPNRGIYNKSRTYTKVLDSNGQVVLDNSLTSTPVIKEKTAFYMNQMLQNVVTNGTGVNARLSNMPAAGKTGTTDDDYDRWFAGYTPYYTCVVWYGFDENKTIVPVSGTSPAVPLWKAVMEKIHENLEPTEFFTPSGTLVKASYCKDSGLAPTEACRSDIRGSRVATGTFFAEDVPTAACNVHKYVTIDAESQQLATEFCPTENLKRVSMLDLDRRFPIQGVTLNDERFTIPANDATGGSSDEGYRVGARVRQGEILHNSYCTLHTEETVQTPDPSDIIPDPGDENNEDDGQNDVDNENGNDIPPGSGDDDEEDETSQEPGIGGDYHPPVPDEPGDPGDPDGSDETTEPTDQTSQPTQTPERTGQSPSPGSATSSPEDSTSPSPSPYASASMPPSPEASASLPEVAEPAEDPAA
ncbi:MAG: PBP1A family penicillin-binding protein [Eubacteriales bacterium]